MKAVDQVQMLSQAKALNPGIKTILRHWYTAQVPDGHEVNADRFWRLLPYEPKYPHADFDTYRWLQVPAATLEGNMQRARDFFDTFIDETFMVHASNVDYVEEWNEYFGNGMPSDERQRFILWSQAVAMIWDMEYRTRPGLEHIRLVLSNTAVGNDIPVETAQAASDYDCLLGYHSYWPTRNNKVPGDAWPFYEGRWVEMDNYFQSQGLDVDWALTEAGPILYYGDWPNVSLGPNDGWRHPAVHDGDVDQFAASLEFFFDTWSGWNFNNGSRCLNPVLFTSGFSGWSFFQIRQPELNQLAEFVSQLSAGLPAPPPPAPAPPAGLPREQYKRVVVVIPPGASEDQAVEIFLENWREGRRTVGGSYDDAGIGALEDKTAVLYGLDEADRQNFSNWFQSFYPGTKVEFRDLPT